MSQISILKRITTKDQQNCEKFNQIVLKKDLNQIYIGRDIDCNYRISSIEISRKHALLEYSLNDNFWSVSDLNSTNGLFINSIQLQPNSPYRLVDGDRVSFGPPNQSQFCYQFVDNYSQNSSNCVSYELSTINLTTIPVIPIVTRIQTTSSNNSVLSSSLHFDIEPNQSRSFSLTTMPTRSGLTYSSSSSRCPRMSGSTVSAGAKKVTSRKTSADSRDTQSLNNFIEHDYSRNSSSNRSSDKNNKNRKISSLKLKTDTEVSTSKSKSSKSSELERKLIAKEKEKLEKSKKSLEQQKTLDRLKIKRKEEELKKKQRELDRKEKEAKKREEELEKMRKDVLKEKKRLEKRQELTKESEQSNKQSAKRKLRSSSGLEPVDNKRQCSEDTKQSVIEEIFESELTCSVCSEYFIQAVNLNCSHTFCLGCIEEWKHSKSGTHVCPICREKIESQNRELILDNLIDQFVVQMKPHLKEHRIKLTEERKKRLEKKAAQSQNNARNGSTSSRGNGLSRLIPSLHFFLRSNTVDTDSDTDDVDVIGLNFANNFLSSSSSNSSASSSESDSDDSDSSDDSNSSDEERDSDSDESTVASIQSLSPNLSYVSDSEESIVSIHSNDSEIRINLFNSFGAEDSDNSSDDSDISIDE